MCVVCGCGDPAAPPPGEGPKVDARTGDLHFGAGAARASVPGMDEQRTLKLEADVLGANDRVAASNRAHFRAHGVVVLNLVSSPGSGKTSLLVRTIEALRRRDPGLALAVIEGDQQTSRDADRIRATGVPAIQVNTGKGCHLDAPMVAAAFARLPLHEHGHAPQHGHGHRHDHDHDHDDDHDHDHEHLHMHVHAHGHDQPPVHAAGHAHAGGRSLLFVENVGNLVCPALWDLGEDAKVAILSVTEGDDKPLKYPDMFAAARLMILNKSDLLPHVEFDVEQCIAHARRVNPGIEVLQLSARTGDGLDAWLDWLIGRVQGRAATATDDAPALRARIAELEAQLAALKATQGA